MAPGIGIDDMFVIVQCWYNLKEDEVSGKSVHEKIGLTMRHAGAAISVTSITDVFAFGIGAVTVSNPTTLASRFSCEMILRYLLLSV